MSTKRIKIPDNVLAYSLQWSKDYLYDRKKPLVVGVSKSGGMEATQDIGAFVGFSMIAGDRSYVELKSGAYWIIRSEDLDRYESKKSTASYSGNVIPFPKG